jgi:dihydrofolate reductase
MKLVVTAYMTLDGVVEAPGFDEHRDGRNAWALRVQNEEDGVYNQGQIEAADALLMGRKTWQIWAVFWPTAPESAMKERINTIPKHVVSRTLRRADWSNSHIISENI